MGGSKNKNRVRFLESVSIHLKTIQYTKCHYTLFQLHIASANGYIDVLEFLLDHHVSMNIRDYDSWLPIHAAACWLQVSSYVCPVLPYCTQNSQNSMEFWLF